MPGKPAPVPTSMRWFGGEAFHARTQEKESRKCFVRMDSDIPDGGEIELLIPFEQFFFVGSQCHHLTPGEMNIEQCLCVVSEFFHDGKL